LLAPDPKMPPDLEMIVRAKKNISRR